MKKLDFQSADEYLTFIESLLNSEITEIIKEPDNEYVFKKNGIWYKIFYNMLVGTDFSQGKCLFLQMGLNRLDFETTYTWQIKNDDRIPKIFDSLKDLYAKNLIVNHQLVKEASLSLAEFLLTCESIEKIHDTIYIINKNEDQYYIRQSTTYKDNKLTCSVYIYKIKDNKQNLIKTFDSNWAESIMSFLNFAYYISRSTHIENIKEAFASEMK